MVAAALQLLQEVLAVEVHQLLQVPEDDAALSPQVLGQVWPLHLGEVVADDVTQGAHVLALRGDHLVHDVPQLAVGRRGFGKGIRPTLKPTLHRSDEHCLLESVMSNYYYY